MDAQAIRRALSDFFRFNPKDFFVQASATGFLVSVARNTGGGGDAAPTPLKLVNASVATKLRIIYGTINGIPATGMSAGDSPPFEFTPSTDFNEGEVWAVLTLAEDFSEFTSFTVDSGDVTPDNTIEEVYWTIGTYARLDVGEDSEHLICAHALSGSQFGKICGSATSEVPVISWTMV